MKRVFAVFLCLLLTAALAVPVLADVIWFPEDDFYFDHMDECFESSQSFTPDRNIIVYASPEDGKREGVIPADTTVELLYIWMDKRGDEWGYTEFWANDAWVRGWVDITNPGKGPAPAAQPVYVIVIVCVLAVAAVCIMLVGRKNY